MNTAGPEPTDPRWRDLRRRTLASLVLVPVALALVWVGGIVFDVAAAALALGLSYEWARLCGRQPAWLVAGLVWIWISILALVVLRADPIVGRANLIFVLLVVWATDIGAYLAGRTIGGTKLAPRISPGKTWAGAAGGLVAALLVGLVASGPAAFGRAALVAAGLSVVGQAGDLAESAVKRRFGVKDSGNLIPGHGGLLDRLDAALAAIPAAALLAILIGHGVVLWR
ncbi:MAG TPA: phosphatidate cytidylyltransferase [Acetobacteraceae bacterium]